MVRAGKQELLKIRRRLEEIEKEVSAAKAELSQYFTSEEQKILAYEASVGKSSTVIGKSGPEELSRYASACERYLEFGREVADCMEGRLRQTTAVRVGTIPEILKNAGCEEMDMYITQKHLRNILHEEGGKMNGNGHYHGIELQKLRQLPELLEKPLAIIADRRQSDTLVVVLEERDRKDRQLIVPVKKNGSAFYREKLVKANFILSVYGKQNIGLYLDQAAREGRIVFLDKNISIRLGGKPLRLRQFLSTDTYINTIRQPEGNVNVLDGKKEEKEAWTEKQGKNKNKEIQDGSSMGQRPFLL